jgi:hypothetical protein
MEDMGVDLLFLGQKQDEKYSPARLRACANRRVAYVTMRSREALQSLSELPCAKSGPPIGAASKTSSSPHANQGRNLLSSDAAPGRPSGAAQQPPLVYP